MEFMVGVGEASTWCIPLILAVRLDGRGTVEVAWQGKGKCGTTRNRNPRKVEAAWEHGCIHISFQEAQSCRWLEKSDMLHTYQQGQGSCILTESPLPPPLLPPPPHSTFFFHAGP